MAKRGKTERIEIRVTHKEKEMIRRAEEVSELYGMSEIVRSGGVALAECVVDVSTGRRTVEEAATRWRELIMRMIP